MSDSAESDVLTDEAILQRFQRTKNQPTGSQTLGLRIVGVNQADRSVDVKPDLTIVWLLVRPELLSPPAAANISSLRAISPPEWPPLWRFVERVALSPRAPSCLG